MQIKPIFLLFVLCFALSGFPEDVVVDAQPNTIVVPDDYPSIFDAIGNSSEGDVVYVKEGSYECPINQSLVVDKSISILGENVDNTKIVLYPAVVPLVIFTQTFWVFDTPVSIDADNVSLSCFTIVSQGTKPIVVSGNGVHIKNNRLSMGLSVNGNFSVLEKNRIEKGTLCTDGFHNLITKNSINVTEFGIESSGLYNNITENYLYGSGGGIHSSGSYNLVYGNNVTADSGLHGGLDISGSENVVAKNNVVNFVGIGGSMHVVYVNTITSNLAIVGNENIFYSNYIQGVILGNANNDASDNVFYHNYFDFVQNPVLPEGEKTFTVWNGVQGTEIMDNGYPSGGNYWSDYTGADSDGDGIGDTPYIICSNNTLNYHNMASFNVANVTLIDSYPLIAPLIAFDAGSWNGITYTVEIVCNSTVSDFRFNGEEKLIRFRIDFENETGGFCRVTIPKTMLSTKEADWLVLLDGDPITTTIDQDAENSYIYFTFAHLAQNVEIFGTNAISEFSELMLMALFLTLSLIIILIRRF